MKDFNKLKWLNNTIQKLLKPCPICGETTDLSIHAPNKNGNEDVTCLKCGLKMEKTLGNSVGAVEWWNKRT